MIELGGILLKKKGVNDEIRWHPLKKRVNDGVGIIKWQMSWSGSHMM